MKPQLTFGHVADSFATAGTPLFDNVKPLKKRPRIRILKKAPPCVQFAKVPRKNQKKFRQQVVKDLKTMGYTATENYPASNE